MKKKKVLIIVHGAWRVHLKNGTAKKVLASALDLLTSKRGITRRDYRYLADYLGRNYDVVESLKWDGKLFEKFDLIPAAQDLEKLLKKYSKDTVDIIAVSVGGFIVTKALENLRMKINKILYLGAVHDSKHKLKNVKKSINVYSKIDKMFFYANDLYEGIGNAVLKGKNVLNVAFENLRHDELCKNIILEEKSYQNKYLFDLYKNLLLQK